MLGITNLGGMGAGAGGAGGVAIASTDLANEDASGGAAYSFLVDTGSGAGRKLIGLLGVQYENPGETRSGNLGISTLTVDGVGASGQVTVSHGTGVEDQQIAHVFTVDLSANGISGTVTVALTLDDDATSAALSALVVNDMESGAATDTSSGSAKSAGSVFTDATVDAQAGGITVGICVSGNAGEGVTQTWGDDLTERSEFQVTGTAHEHGVGYDLGERAAATETVTLSASAYAALAVAAFR